MENVRGKLTYRRDGVIVTLKFDLDGQVENDDLVISPTIGAAVPGDHWIVTVTPRATVTLLAAELRVSVPVPPASRIFVNGYQTWTESRELGPRDRIAPLNRLARSRCSMYGDYEFVANPGFPGRFHGWTYGYVRARSDLLTLFGSLSEQTGFTLVTVTASGGRVVLQKECGGVVIGEPYVLYDVYVGTGTDQETFGRYFDLLGLRPPRVSPLTGWTSWYNYYTGITQDIIQHNLDALNEHSVPLDVFQIDDGWEHAVGDWLTANHKPQVKDLSYGFWRRILMVPFTRNFGKEERDPHLAEKLKTELPGILAWAVRGCAEWQKRGIAAPPEVVAANEEYQLESDSLGRFIAERCLVAPEESALAGQLFTAYRGWAESEGLAKEALLSKNEFGVGLKERFSCKATNQGRVYQGLAVRPWA